MSKTKLTPIEQMAAEVREELLTVVIPCRAKGEPFHFSPRGRSVASVAKLVGVTDPTIRALAEGRAVSMRTLGKVQDGLARIRETEATVETA